MAFQFIRIAPGEKRTIYSLGHPLARLQLESRSGTAGSPSFASSAVMQPGAEKSPVHIASSGLSLLFLPAMERCLGIRGLWLLAAVLLCAAASGCAPMHSKLVASNDRDWRPDQAILPHAKFKGDQVKVYNIRNCIYRSDEDYIVRHYDKTFDLNQLKTVDFLVVPFPDAPDLAHTMLSFGFEDEEYVVISIEIRREKGESYSPVAGALRQYEIMYVVADERDAIGVRTNIRNNDVYLYRSTATPEQARALFVDMLNRANKLRAEPEFYDTFTNNCTTNIVKHVNNLQPGSVPYTIHVLLPGHADRLAYDLGLLDRSRPFEELKRLSRINDLAGRYSESPDFSKKIRRF